MRLEPTDIPVQVLRSVCNRNEQAFIHIWLFMFVFLFIIGVIFFRKFSLKEFENSIFISSHLFFLFPINSFAMYIQCVVERALFSHFAKNIRTYMVPYASLDKNLRSSNTLFSRQKDVSWLKKN